VSDDDLDDRMQQLFQEVASRYARGTDPRFDPDLDDDLDDSDLPVTKRDAREDAEAIISAIRDGPDDPEKGTEEIIKHLSQIEDHRAGSRFLRLF
jgi:hypothetical protein